MNNQIDLNELLNSAKFKIGDSAVLIKRGLGKEIGFSLVKINKIFLENSKDSFSLNYRVSRSGIGKNCYTQQDAQAKELMTIEEARKVFEDFLLSTF